MKKFFLLFAFVVLASIPAMAYDCNASVIDNAGVGVNDSNLSQLSRLGADPHIITENSYAGTPEQLVNEYQRACQSWKSTNGGVKSNLIVFVLFPKAHKIGMYTGQDYSNISTSEIRSAMVPAFRGGDFSKGLIVGVNRTADAIFAYQHPKQTVVNETPTDYSGLWKFLDWALAILFLGGLGFLIWIIYKHNQARKAERLAAQKEAVQARAEAADYVNNHPEDEYAAERFARLSNSESMNPDGDFGAEDYRVIAAAYRNLPKGRKKDTYVAPEPTPEPVAYTQGYTDVTRESTYTPSPVPPSAPSVSNTNINVVAPVVVEEPEPVHHHHHSDSDDSPSWSSPWSGGSSSSSDSSSGSGWSSSSSSSSWDSSSSSSSWSDSSSSSSFGGDSGGGFSGGDSSW